MGEDQSIQGGVFEKTPYLLKTEYLSDKIVRVSFGRTSIPERESLIVTGKSNKRERGDQKAAIQENGIRKSGISDGGSEKEDTGDRTSKDDRPRGREKESSLHAEVDADLNVRFLWGEKLLSSFACPVLEPYDIYTSAGGRLEIKNTADGIRNSVVGGEKQFVRQSDHATVDIFLDGKETLFGMGSHEEGYPCLNGQFVPLYQENLRIAIPVFVSNKGYAYLFDCTSYMSFDNRVSAPAVMADDVSDSSPHRGNNIARIYMDSVETVDLFFICGEDFDDICRSLRFLTGETPMLPKWCCGYIQSKERYQNQEELLETAKEYRRRKIPLDGIVQDWMYWRDGLWGDKNFDPGRFPDMKSCTDELHGMGVKLMISIWSSLQGDSGNRNEFIQKNMLLADGSVYNAFDEGARDLYWKQAYEGLFKFGIDAWWCDSTEPFDAVWDGAERDPLEVRIKKSTEEFKKYLDDSLINAFSLVHSKGIYENQRKTCPEKRVVNLTRSGMAGQHKYGTVVWSGDVSASWETLSKQVHILQNYTACGEAYWNSDIGGFFVNNHPDKWFWAGDYPKGCEDEEYRELYTRWFQFAVFTPLLRSHGTDTPREIWRFEEEGSVYYEAIRKSIELRYRLLPYFYSVNAAVTFEGRMPVRALALAYPGEDEACGIFDEYLYGKEFLVCPVTKPGQRSKNIYLPRGVWYDFYTEERYEGGKQFEVSCEIDKIPFFVKAGAVIPTVGPVQSTEEIRDAAYELRIYSGADGEFFLYDDDGQSYEYENGRYSRIRIVYHDGTRKIETIQLGMDEFAHLLEFRIV